MHTLFAIEPAAINNWHDFRYVIEKFGFSKGMLIAKYPSTWPKMVLEACKGNVSDNEYLKIVEKLQQAKENKWIKTGFPYMPSMGWKENLNNQGVIDKLNAVLVASEADDHLYFSVDSAHEMLFENNREVEVKRIAKELARAAQFIIADASSIYIVDPYFQPKNKCLKVLEELICLAKDQKSKLRDIFVFSAHSVDPRHKGLIENDYRKSLSKCDSKGMSFHFYLLDDDNLEWDFHARYLLSNVAGLRFDRGFVEPEPHEQREHKTDVVCLEVDTVERLYRQYGNNDLGLKYIEYIYLDL